jgi:hypothetical protein
MKGDESDFLDSGLPQDREDGVGESKKSKPQSHPTPLLSVCRMKKKWEWVFLLKFIAFVFSNGGVGDKLIYGNLWVF